MKHLYCCMKHLLNTKSLKSPFDIPFLHHIFHSEANTGHDVWESESNINIYTRIKNKDKHEYAAALYWFLSNLSDFYLENVDCAHRDRNVYTVPFIADNFNIDVLFCIIAHSQRNEKKREKRKKSEKWREKHPRGQSHTKIHRNSVKFTLRIFMEYFVNVENAENFFECIQHIRTERHSKHSQEFSKFLQLPPENIDARKNLYRLILLDILMPIANTRHFSNFIQHLLIDLH